MADEKDPYDGEYVGNIFGWRLSMIGLAVMIVMGALIAWRHHALDQPVGFEDPLEMEGEREKYAPAGSRDTL